MKEIRRKRIVTDIFYQKKCERCGIEFETSEKWKDNCEDCLGIIKQEKINEKKNKFIGMKVVDLEIDTFLEIISIIIQNTKTQETYEITCGYDNELDVDEMIKESK